MKRGIVVSDLHLLSSRSEGQDRFGILSERLREVDTLVLNGDIFDFRWAIRPHAESIPLAMDWLAGLRSEYPELEIHFIPGNHDCLPEFTTRVEALRAISLHPRRLILGRNLFLHGDAATYRMNDRGFLKFRSPWENDRPRSRWKARFYDFYDAVKLTALTHQIWFRGDAAVRRIAWHLEETAPGWRDEIDHCYFGHTHLPIRDVRNGGVLFHNTGSGIRGMEFSPLEFSYRQNEKTKNEL